MIHPHPTWRALNSETKQTDKQNKQTDRQTDRETDKMIVGNSSLSIRTGSFLVWHKMSDSMNLMAMVPNTEWKEKRERMSILKHNQSMGANKLPWSYNINSTRFDPDYTPKWNTLSTHLPVILRLHFTAHLLLDLQEHLKRNIAHRKLQRDGYDSHTCHISSLALSTTFILAMC